MIINFHLIIVIMITMMNLIEKMKKKNNKKKEHLSKITQQIDKIKRNKFIKKKMDLMEEIAYHNHYFNKIIKIMIKIIMSSMLLKIEIKIFNEYDFDKSKSLTRVDDKAYFFK